MNIPKMRVWAGIGFLYLSACLSGCISSKELVLYQAKGPHTDTLAIAPRYIPTIKAGDVLSVQVGSLSPEATAFFNPYAAISLADRAGTPQVATPTTPIPYTPGYLVNEEGQIALPLLGAQQVQGLTNSQAAAQIRTKLLDYLKSKAPERYQKVIGDLGLRR